MVKDSRINECKSSSHQLFKDRVKSRVDDLQELFIDLQSARKESRKIDANVFEEQVHQTLREWKSDLNKPSPASSWQQGGSRGTLSSEIYRLLQLNQEEDDATSALTIPKPEPEAQKVVDGNSPQVGFNFSKGTEDGVNLVDQSKEATHGVNNMEVNCLSFATKIDHLFGFHAVPEEQCFSAFYGTNSIVGNGEPKTYGYERHILPPPFAFLGPKCALWDCLRPALDLDWCQESNDYCSVYHSLLATGEGYLGKPPVVRPGGIDVKDNLIIAALVAKSKGKEVGIPECKGSATAKSPWNAPELFDLSLLDSEKIREWLFFDKPRRAFDTGNRKQRSLPDYGGRGWHESRKQVMNDFGGLKRSYYMDPQPVPNFEWHLYEYEIKKYDAYALYRLEVKHVEGRMISKGKTTNNSFADLQKKMGRLTAEFRNDKLYNPKRRGKANLKYGAGNTFSAPNFLASIDERIDHEVGVSCDYLVDDIDGYYIM